MFAVILVLAGLHLSGREAWVGYGVQGLMLLAIVVVLMRAVRCRKVNVSRTVADSGSVVNDLYLGTTYSGPRHVAPPQGKQTELIIDDDERREFLKALDDADARPEQGASEERI